MNRGNSIHRREFLRRTGLAGGALACGPLANAQAPDAVSLVLDPSEAVASAPPALWAAQELQKALADSGTAVTRREHPEVAPLSEFCVVVSGTKAPLAASAMKAAGVIAPDDPESLVLLTTKIAAHQALLVCGSDTRGLVYALLDLADRARRPMGSRGPLFVSFPLVERPANEVRSVMRQFTSEPLDKPWFYDREMWPRYLTMLATERFNRFHLAFGFGYDSLQQVADSYLLFAYPFLLDVPGYRVRVTNLPDDERDRNLETLRFISEQTAARGIDFELGIWMHGYQLGAGSRARYVVEGLNAENHAAYCRDALTAVLKACPAISSVGLRIHGESGIAEGSYDFWRTVFDGVKRCGRRVEIDLHAKGIDQTMIANAENTGMRVNLSPKYWAEHRGMPYHQAAIRELEMPVEGHTGAGLMTLSEGARVFTRYGYADLLREDRRYTVRHRVFSGTQRLLLSGDGIWAAAYSRAYQFCGSTGADLMEPLTCRGRRGSGGAGNRQGYADASLATRWDWQKYAFWYRLNGRLMYDPGTNWDVWRRELHPSALENALAYASRILPIVTTAHMPSAACDAYWPEIYWNQPMVTVARANPYTDSPSPRTFCNVSPLDPQLFSRICDFADELLKRKRSGKYSPVEVAQWLEDLTDSAEEELGNAGDRDSADFRRLLIDVKLQVGLGRFFAAKFRSGVLYVIHTRTGDRAALEEALAAYRQARAAWAGMKESAGAYAADLSVSDRFSERGQWNDRLSLIDQDIAEMEQGLEGAITIDDEHVASAVAEALGRPKRVEPKYRHQPPARFRRKEPVPLEIAVLGRARAVRLYYRHVNQAERFESVEMEAWSETFRATIPGSYTDSPYPLQYYFEARESAEKAWLYPGFTLDLANQPYFVIRRG
ncbi:MAG TPA: twin-arginine translocation signal domain-containing protein [Bryobacteraceae bacterium]|nr:twin-arginine translocation signal domain-containing protein [Bryobacteraceae bacterium]